jgi:hypothetical protein
MSILCFFQLVSKAGRRAISLGLIFWSMVLVVNSEPAEAKINFFAEPYVGIAKLELDFDDTGFGTGSFKEVSNGFYIGSKAGLKATKKLLVGFDYHVAGPFEFGDALSGAEWNHTMIGAGLGLDYKVIRFWLGYYFQSEIDDSTNDVVYKGTAIKGGFGLVVNKKMRANLELVFYQLDKAESNGISVDVEGVSVHSTHVSLSFPFD